MGHWEILQLSCAQSLRGWLYSSNLPYLYKVKYCCDSICPIYRRPLDAERNWDRMDCEITTNASYTGLGSQLGQVLISAIPDTNNTLLGNYACVVTRTKLTLFRICIHNVQPVTACLLFNQPLITSYYHSVVQNLPSILTS